MTLEIRTITAAQTLDLRQRVLWPQKSRSEMILPKDDTALHFGAFQGGALVGVGSFFKDTEQTFRLRKMAVEPRVQGKGIARAVILAAATHIERIGGRSIWCDARVSAVGFYQKCGFSVDTIVFEKSGLDYVKARLHL